MAINVSSQLEERLHRLVEEGRFENLEELFEASLSLLDPKEEEMTAEELEVLRAEIDRSIEEADAGQAAEFSLPELKRMVRGH